MFSFNEKLFGLLVKDIEAMDPSILKGEAATGKRQKVCFISNLYAMNLQINFLTIDNFFHIVFSFFLDSKKRLLLATFIKVHLLADFIVI